MSNVRVKRNDNFPYPGGAMMKSLATAIACFFALMAATSVAQAATMSVADATIVSSNYVNADASGAVGRNGANTLDFRAFAAFQVDQILLNEGLTLGDLATRQFTFSFDTIGVKMLAAGSYRADYIGFFQDSSFPDSGQAGSLPDWPAFTSYNTGTEVNSGIADTNAAQSLTISSFTLTGVTEADANDFVLFGVRYDEPQAAVVSQALSGYRLALIPEPSSFMLTALGLLSLGFVVWRCRRR